MAKSSSSCKRRQRWNMFFHSIEPRGLAGDRRAVVPASGFSFSAQQIWKIIKENKDLDLHKVMVATVGCEEIFNEKYTAFSANELVQSAYQSMLGHVRSKAMEKFKEMFNNVLNGGKGFAVVASECS